MTVILQDAFTGGAAVLPDPPWRQVALVAQTLNRDGSGNAKASAFNVADDVFAYDDANTYPGDHYAEIKVGGGLSINASYVEVIARAAGTGGTFQAYSFNTDGGSGASHTLLDKWAGGVGSNLASFATTVAIGDILRIEVVGPVITCYKNGVKLGSFTDVSTPLTGGAPGCGVYNASANSAIIDSFNAGTLRAQIQPQIVDGRRRRKRTGSVKQIKNVVAAPPLVTRIVRGRQTVVRKRKLRPDRKGKTTQIKRARLAAQPAPKKPPKTQFVILKKKRRPERVAKTTLVKRARLAAQPAPKRPPKVQTLVLRKKVRPTRKARTTQITRTRLAITPPVVRPPKTATIVQRPKRRLRQGVTKILAALISTPPVLVKPAISLVEGRRRRKRTGSSTILKGAKRAAVAASIAPKKSTIVLSKKRRRRTGSIDLIRPHLFTTPPLKSTIVLAKKRRRRVGNIKQIKAPLQPQIASVKPRKTLFLVMAKKRKPRKTSVQKLAAKKSVVPVSVVPRAPLTVSLKKKHRKLQAKTTLLRAKRAGNQPITPPRPPKIVAGRRRRRRTGDVIQITGAKRAPVPSVRPVKTLFQILPKKRRKKRTASTIRVTGARRAPPVAPRRKPLIVRRPKARKQISRKKTLILLKALFANPVVQFPAIITCFSGPSFQVVSKSGESIIVTSLSNDQTKLRAIQ